MSFIGNVPSEAFSATVKDTFNGDGSTVDFTLSIPGQTNELEVFVENVQQEPTTAYTVSGTTLTFTAAPVSGTGNIYVVHRGPAVQTVVPPTGVVLNASTVNATGNISTEGDLKIETTSGGIYTVTGTDTATNRTLTLPDEAGTVVTNTGADFTDQVTVTKTSAGASTNGLIVKNADNTAGTAASIGFAAHGSGVETHRVEAAVDGANSYSMRFYTYQSGLNERMRINAGTGLLIGTTNNSPAESASVNGIRLGYNGGIQAGKAGDEVMRLNRNTNDGRIIGLAGQSAVRGEIAVSGTTIQYTSFSDYRLKENVTAIANATTQVKTLNPVNFDWIETGQNVNGFLAHEVQTVVPEAVTGTHNQVEVWAEGEELPEGVSVGDNKLDENGNTIPVYQGIDQSKLVPLLTGALQEAIAKIETLETTVADLQTRVTALESV